MKLIDRSAKDIFDKLDNIFPNLSFSATNSSITANNNTINYNEWLKKMLKTITTILREIWSHHDLTL